MDLARQVFLSDCCGSSAYSWRGFAHLSPGQPEPLVRRGRHRECFSGNTLPYARRDTAIQRTGYTSLHSVPGRESRGWARRRAGAIDVCEFSCHYHDARHDPCEGQSQCGDLCGRGSCSFGIADSLRAGGSRIFSRCPVREHTDFRSTQMGERQIPDALILFFCM